MKIQLNFSEKLWSNSQIIIKYENIDFFQCITFISCIKEDNPKEILQPPHQHCLEPEGFGYD